MSLLTSNKSLENEWNDKGSAYAKGINEMIEFGENHGWENWKSKEPKDDRAHLAEDVLKLLRTANSNNTVTEFREKFPPAHAPFIKYYEEQGQYIENFCFISEDKIAFVIGNSYQKRQAFTLTGRVIEKLNENIISIGKAHKNEIYAIADNSSIVTYQGWLGKRIWKFKLPEIDNLTISQLIPYNDGLKVLLVSSEGIYLLERNDNSLIHPVPDLTDSEWTSDITMEHASLSHDNKLIAVGDQCSEHRILNEVGTEIAEIGPQSSYPHFALFAKDNQQVVMNSCHFYNGTTIGVLTKNIKGVKIEAYTKDERYNVIDNDCRVYAGVATTDYYIFGDAGGNIKAFTKDGKKVWRHFLGSTISGMTISDDEKTLWVGACSGIIHKLHLSLGKRDDHTIGNGDHFEDLRIIFWKNEKHPLIW